MAERKDGNVQVVEVLEPRIDAVVSDDLKENLLRVASGGHRWIVIDLSRVEFIDSMGLSAIISARIQVGKEGEIVICGLNSNVQNVFKFTRMDKVFRMYSSVEEAISALEQQNLAR